MDTSNWKWFRYDEIFNISTFRGETLLNLEPGTVPYVSSTESNNGVSDYINNDTIITGNKITVARNGSVGSAFYQPIDFYPSPDDIRIFDLKGHTLSPGIALFLCTIIEKERYRYTYGRKFGTARMKESMIKLPVTPGGTPDWQYMESFIKDRILPQLPKKAQKVWLLKYDTKPQKQEAMKLNTEEWKEFFISDLFDVRLTKGDIKADEVEAGDIPLISSGESNNGVVKYISKDGDGKAEIFPANTITLDMFCHANYQGVSYYAVGHGRVNILIPKFELNKFIGLFICTLINREVYRFSYGRAVYSSVAEKMIIRLPVTPSGTPDWQFMEDYIKSLPYSKNLEPSDPNEVVDELMEVKKRVIEMERQIKSMNGATTVNIYGEGSNYYDQSKHITIN